MEPTLNHANIVLVALNHNPAIVSKEWLDQNDILKEEPINFSPSQNRSLVETSNYSIDIVRQRVTIATRNPDKDKLDNLKTIASQYVKALPNLSYSAVGLNSNWTILPTHSDLLKKIFVVDPEKVKKTFQDKMNYDIGGIVFYQHNPFRVQLIIPPQQNNQIVPDFNYHSDITNLEQLRERITYFTSAIKHACDTIRKLLGD